MSKWYRTERGRAIIVEIEVDGFTEKTVTIGGRRRPRDSQWDKFWPTWDEAHAYLMKRYEQEVTSLRFQLENAKSALGNVKGLKRPVIDESESQS